MKRFLSSKLSALLVAYALIGFTVMSCVDKDANYSHPSDIPNAGFTFSTTHEVQLSVQYDANFKVQFEIYTENPYRKESDGRIVKRTDIAPKLIRMTDASGKYSGKEILPTYLDGEIYIYSSSVGVPSLYKTTLQSVIQAAINWDTWYEPFSESQVARAVGNFVVPKEFGILGDWDVKGRPTNYLDSEGELSLENAFLGVINKTIPENGTCKPKYRQSVDFEVYDEQNREVEVKVRFIGGTSAASSAFGYYCYQKGASDAEIEKAKKYIIFPNTKTGVGIKGGECVTLHYINEKGEDKGTSFPNHTMIGWFIRNDAFKNGNIGNGYGMFYSTPTLTSNDGKRTHTAAFKIDEFIVLSFEDWTDSDYNDVMFNVLATPKEAIIVPDFPVVNPGEDLDNDQAVAYTMTYKGILAFEDNWPSKGDYDLNDVVVKYNSVLSFNTKNQVLSAVDTYTSLWSGAAYQNSFMYQLATDRTNVETSSNMDQDLSLATFTVFADMKEATGNNTKTSTTTITNRFKKPINHESFGVAPYNPFISVFKQVSNNRVEVHLVNNKPTLKANMSLFHTGEDVSEPDKGNYYVSAQKYPFAIHLSDAERYSTEEGKVVDVTYPRFASWALSNGAKDKDWYLK